MAERRELQPGETLGPYRLESVLGEGGMGIVFRARREDGLEVALKVLKLELGGDLMFQHRFRQEARAAAEVSDPHLLPIVETAQADGRHYIASAYAPGGSLADRLEGGPLPPAEAVAVAAAVAAGLDALHAAGVVHRDVKPSNVLFGADGTPMLTDFGLAKGRAYTVLTRPGQILGTLDYLAPELIRGEPATPASDLYALGCVAYECVAGRAPFADRSLFEVGLAHLEETPEPPAPEAPELSTAVLAALEKEPDRRPASAGEYGAMLRRGLAETAAA
ncbi:MAG TPA: serine/threonine-protein kinase [Gaiellaceae bacterium]|nr:serine/threonine-protein kinase [Gaiellaceae bacterium]